jgi:hypothetical protein
VKNRVPHFARKTRDLPSTISSPNSLHMPIFAFVGGEVYSALRVARFRGVSATGSGCGASWTTISSFSVGAGMGLSPAMGRSRRMTFEACRPFFCFGGSGSAGFYSSTPNPNKTRNQEPRNGGRYGGSTGVKMRLMIPAIKATMVVPSITTPAPVIG